MSKDLKLNANSCVCRTQRVDAVIDDELPVSQIVQDGLKVVRTAIYEIRAAGILLVAPHI